MLVNYWNIFYDTDTGLTYYEDGEPTGFSFEKNPFGTYPIHTAFNPFQYATIQTADRAEALVKEIVDEKFPGAVITREDSRFYGGHSTPQRLIVIKSGSAKSEQSAGLIANTWLRSGRNVAKRSVADIIALDFSFANKDEERSLKVDKKKKV